MPQIPDIIDFVLSATFCCLLVSSVTALNYLNFTALASVSITLWFMPLDSLKANILEVYNDCTLLALTYLLWCFTDMVRESETSYELGYYFIAVCLGNIAVHMVIMLGESGKKAKLSC